MIKNVYKILMCLAIVIGIISYAVDPKGIYSIWFVTAVLLAFASAMTIEKEKN